MTKFTPEFIATTRELFGSDDSINVAASEYLQALDEIERLQSGLKTIGDISEIRRKSIDQFREILDKKQAYVEQLEMALKRIGNEVGPIQTDGHATIFGRICVIITDALKGK